MRQCAGGSEACAHPSYARAPAYITVALIIVIVRTVHSILHVLSGRADGQPGPRTRPPLLAGEVRSCVPGHQIIDATPGRHQSLKAE